MVVEAAIAGAGAGVVEGWEASIIGEVDHPAVDETVLSVKRIGVEIAQTGAEIVVREATNVKGVVELHEVGALVWQATNGVGTDLKRGAAREPLTHLR